MPKGKCKDGPFNGEEREYHESEFFVPEEQIVFSTLDPPPSKFPKTGKYKWDKNAAEWKWLDGSVRK